MDSWDEKGATLVDSRRSKFALSAVISGLDPGVQAGRCDDHICSRCVPARARRPHPLRQTGETQENSGKCNTCRPLNARLGHSDSWMLFICYVENRNPAPPSAAGCKEPAGEIFGLLHPDVSSQEEACFPPNRHQFKLKCLSRDERWSCVSPQWATLHSDLQPSLHLLALEIMLCCVICLIQLDISGTLNPHVSPAKGYLVLQMFQLAQKKNVPGGLMDF